VTTPIQPATRALIQSAYTFFNERKIDAVLELMHADVVWPNGMEGGYVHGHTEVREYWTRQWAIIDPHVSPVNISPGPDGQVIVKVHQTVRDLRGTLLFDKFVHHVYRIEAGRIRSMEIE